jgi:hypothetical protein
MWMKNSRMNIVYLLNIVFFFGWDVVQALTQFRVRSPLQSTEDDPDTVGMPQGPEWNRLPGLRMKPAQRLERSQQRLGHSEHWE